MFRITMDIRTIPVLVLLVAFFTVIPFFYGCDPSNAGISATGEFSLPWGRTYNYEDILVTRVIDGDTLKLENGKRVRLIGIDTPEMHESAKLDRDSQRSGQDKKAIQAMGRRSSDFTKGLVEGKRVRLEFDVERLDRYDRILAYVYLGDGTFVNAEIIKQGYASLMTYPPNVRHVDIFKQLYREARENNRGLWKE
ncbi:MAG: thermonuclease family protein [Candidatus Omnitrophica bacterium]|nr:thermonuclease family protein [Candidatus Omnitrophota bacterium]